jgi:hypothetical protein
MNPKSKSSSRQITVSFEALLAAFPSMRGSLWREDTTSKRARQRRNR